VPAQPFADNNQIAVASRPYVDFLRTHGIISGDGSGNFVPNSMVNRASLALMIDRILNLQSDLESYWPHQREETNDSISPVPSDTPTPPVTTTPPSTPIPPAAALPSIQAPSAPLPIIPNISTELTGVIHEIDVEAEFLSTTIRFLTPAGVENSSVLGLRLAINFEIFQNNEAISFENLNIGDAVKLTIVDGRITVIRATERNRSFTATLVSIEENAIIVNNRNEIEEIGIGRNTRFERQGEGTVPISAFRLGDEIDIVIEDNIATSLFAFGELSTVDGTVRSLSVNGNIITITLETSSGEKILYRRGTLPGVYANSRVRFHLDSSEVLSFSILN
jgi:hypothetical protein